MYEYRKLTPEQRAELVRERRTRGFPAHAPPHRIPNQPFYLLTAACYEHACHMTLTARRQQVVDGLFEHFIAAGWDIHAWVVLPNHYHLLASVLDFAALGGCLRRVHGATSRQWNLEDSIVGRKVWFRFTDRAIRSEAHYYTTLNYLHYNPVKHGWAASPYAWSESSVHWYQEHFGRPWLRDLWTRYPVREYGRDWDDMLPPPGAKAPTTNGTCLKESGSL
jgi:putative transposase